jgi:hypothetical protein
MKNRTDKLMNILDQFTKNQLKFIIAESIDDISKSACYFMRACKKEHSTGLFFSYKYLLVSLKRISQVIKYAKKNKELFK